MLFQEYLLPLNSYGHDQRDVVLNHVMTEKSVMKMRTREINRVMLYETVRALFTPKFTQCFLVTDFR